MTEERPRTFHATYFVSDQAVKQSDSLALVTAEGMLLKELYEAADYPRDFRIRFQHVKGLDSGIHPGINIEGQLDVIDATNPRVEPDPKHFQPPSGLSEDLRKGTSGIFDKNTITNTSNPTQSKSFSLDDLVKAVYEPKIMSEVRMDERYIQLAKYKEKPDPDPLQAIVMSEMDKYYVRNHSHTALGPEPIPIDTMTWAGGTFTYEVDDQVLARSDAEMTSTLALKNCLEAMRSSAKEAGVPFGVVIPHETKVQKNPIKFTTIFMVYAPPLTFRRTP